MVRKLKKPVHRTAAGRPRASGWLVGFDPSGQASVWVHRHGDGDDHSRCGPVVMCCERARPAYAKLFPSMVERTTAWNAQGGDHLSSWFAGGLEMMYFVLCDPDSTDAIYAMGLSSKPARALLEGRVTHDAWRRPELRLSTSTHPASGEPGPPPVVE